MIKTEFQSPIISLMCILRRNKINKLGKSTKIRLCKACLLFKRQIGVCRGLVIAKPRLPLTRELSSKARLRERKGCGFMRLYFSPSVFLLTQKSTSQLPFRSVLLSLRLEIATGNPHPRQREARAVATASSLQTQICFFTALFCL